MVPFYSGIQCAHIVLFQRGSVLFKHSVCSRCVVSAWFRLFRHSVCSRCVVSAWFRFIQAFSVFTLFCFSMVPFYSSIQCVHIVLFQNGSVLFRLQCVHIALFQRGSVLFKHSLCSRCVVSAWFRFIQAFSVFTLRCFSVVPFYSGIQCVHIVLFQRGSVLFKHSVCSHCVVSAWFRFIQAFSVFTLLLDLAALVLTVLYLLEGGRKKFFDRDTGRMFLIDSGLLISSGLFMYLLSFQ